MIHAVQKTNFRKIANEKQRFTYIVDDNGLVNNHIIRLHGFNLLRTLLNALKTSIGASLEELPDGQLATRFKDLRIAVVESFPS
jgi:hypothetical protein